MSIFEDIQKSDNFSGTENQIIQYLIENQEAVEKITINELASKTFSSNATIIRICHKLGYSGFREFKIAFVREIENKRLVVKSIDYSFPFHADESSAVIVQNIYSLFKESMDAVQSELDVHVLEQIVDTIEKSQRVFMFGVGDTKLTIQSFINRVAKINIFPILATEHGEHPFICPHIESKDCTIFITYRGNGRSFEKEAKYLKRKGVKIIVLTGNKDSYLSQNSDCCICIPNLEKESRITTFYSQMVFQYILSLIFSLLYRDFSKDN